MTLVDCPGHASLIRTIIGGAQIIDMMLLVIDINKGIQTQTAECLVIGEITTDNIIVVLNKVDMIPPEERAEKVDKMIKKMKKMFKSTKFSNPQIVVTSAFVGGEKVASIGTLMSVKDSYPTLGIEELMDRIAENVKIPQRSTSGRFLYAIDHCFPIKGHGTVITGTVLSGSVSVNSAIEIPQLQVTKKVKSMQMFRKPVKSASQGDRVAICVTNLESTAIERAIACSPNSVNSTTAILCLVKKIRFFKMSCPSGAKYHISLGHETILSTVHFFGAKEMNAMHEHETESDANVAPEDVFGIDKDDSTAATSIDTKRIEPEPSVGPESGNKYSFPELTFDWQQDFEKQEEICSRGSNFIYGNESVQWALLLFPRPIFCPTDSLVIGSRLDTDVTEGSSTENLCRLAFYGPVKQVSLPDDPYEHIRIYNIRYKEAVIVKITDSKEGVCKEAIGWHLGGTGNTFIEPYIGMKISTDLDHVGSIVSPFGSDGKFRIKFEHGARVKVSSKLTLRFKKFIHDKRITQDGLEFRSTPISFEDKALHNSDQKASMNCKEINLENKSSKDKDENNHTGKIICSSDETKSVKEHENTTSNSAGSSIPSDPSPHSVASSTSIPNGDTIDPGCEVRIGKIESIKQSDENKEETIAIVSGAFRVEENVKMWLESTALTSDGSSGVMIGPFAKMGKCKVKFQSQALQTSIGDEVRIYLRKST